LIKKLYRAIPELDAVSADKTVPATEVFVRALRDEEPLRPYLLPKPSPPYWYERYA